MHICVKNTFVDIEDADEEVSRGMTRSRSDSSISLSGRSAQNLHLSSSGHVVWGKVERVTSSSETPSGSEATSRATSRRNQCPDDFKVDSRSDITSSDDTGLDDMKQSSRSMSTQHATAASSCGPSDAALENSGHPKLEEDDSREAELPADRSFKAPSVKVVAQHREVPSIGSAEHTTGKCKPCMFVHSLHGCADGFDCPYCHYAHKGKRRPCKSKRDRYQKRINSLASDEPCDSQGLAGEPQPGRSAESHSSGLQRDSPAQPVGLKLIPLPKLDHDEDWD